MKAKASSETFLGRLGDFFASVKLSFALLLSLAVTSIAGTVIPQHEPAQVYLRGYGQTWGKLVLSLGLDDMYHAPWFVLLMMTLAVNLVVCSWRRLPQALKIINKDPAKDLERTPNAQHSFTRQGTLEQSLAQAKELLARRLGPVHLREQEGGAVLFAQKGAWSRLGVYIVHSSVLVILAGALVGIMWGFSGRVNIDQGKSVDHIVLDNGEPLALGFSVRLDKFSVSFYDNGMPSEYRSEVTFVEKGKEAAKASLVVNDPGQHQGIDFYQSSYGQNLKSLKVRLTREGKSQEVELGFRQWSPLPGGGQAGVAEYREKVDMGKMYQGPMARVGYQADAKAEPVLIPAFAAGAKFPIKGPIKVEILKASSVPFTGLQVKYDPGVWFIWIGCSLMVLGFLVAFYLSHRKVWLRLTPAGAERIKVELAGSTNKNRLGLARLLEHLAAQMGRVKEQGE